MKRILFFLITLVGTSISLLPQSFMVFAGDSINVYKCTQPYWDTLVIVNSTNKTILVDTSLYRISSYNKDFVFIGNAYDHETFNSFVSISPMNSLKVPFTFALHSKKRAIINYAFWDDVLVYDQVYMEISSGTVKAQNLFYKAKSKKIYIDID